MSAAKNVKAIECTGVGQLKLREFPRPVLGDDCILLKVIRCGVCGTDLHGIQGKRALKFPIIPGHEIVAVVEEVGKSADRIKIFGAPSIKKGDRVTINPRIVCGKCCYCQRLPQKPEMCLHAETYNSSIRSDQSPYLFGGWSEYMVILPGSELILLPDGLSDDLAVLSEPFACAVGCLDRYYREHTWMDGDGFAIDRAVVVVGVGAIGVLMCAAFKMAGANRIIAVDVNEERLQLAKEFGVDTTLNVGRTDSEERIETIRDMTDGLGASICIEACGVKEMIKECVYYLRRGGKLFELGHLARSGLAEFDPQFLCRNEIEILGHYAYPSSRCLGYGARLLQEHRFPYEKLIKVYPLADYHKVLLEESKGRGEVKSVFAM